MVEHEFEIDKDSGKLIYVLFGDNWCSVCKDVLYILKEIKNKSIPIYIIDISKNLDLMSKYSIEDIPTVIVFNKKIIIDFIVGKHAKSKYLAYTKLLSGR